MSNARNLARLIVDSGGDVEVSSLGNVPPSNDASALTTGTLPVGRIPYLTNRNRIINGDMRIDQRNAGASVTPVNLYSTYTLDRWNTSYSVGSKFSVQQNAGSVTPPEGFTNYLGATSLSAYSITSETFSIVQTIEGYNIADLGWGTVGAKTITVSFWVRSSLTGTFGGALQNSANNRGYPFSYTINAANTWEKKTITITGETTGTWLTNNGYGISLLFSLGCGASYLGTAGSWSSSAIYGATGQTNLVGTSGATFYITGVQLEEGSVATPFCPAGGGSYGAELALCQRYWQVVVNNTFREYIYNVHRHPISLRVSMRAAPSITVVHDGSNGPSGGVDTGYFTQDSGTVAVSTTATGGSPGSTGMVDIANLDIFANAEL